MTPAKAAFRLARSRNHRYLAVEGRGLGKESERRVTFGGDGGDVDYRELLVDDTGRCETRTGPCAARSQQPRVVLA